MFNVNSRSNARAALKEYGDQAGLPVQFEVMNGGCNAPEDGFTAKAKVGDLIFGPATSTTKKEAKEFAADRALKELSIQEQNCQHVPAAESEQNGKFFLGESLFPNLSPVVSAPRFQFSHEHYHQMPTKQRGKKKTSQLSASPDKDPVMLLNEYGQKHRVEVKFEDIPFRTPGRFEAQVVVGNQTFGPEKASKKKIARKMAAICALKELIHWQPAGQEFIEAEETTSLQLYENEDEKISSGETTPSSVHCTMDPVIALNEFCQRNRIKMEFEDLGYFGPDHKRVYSFRVTVGDREFSVGYGPSKKLAKKKAASRAVNELFDLQAETENEETPSLEPDSDKDTTDSASFTANVDKNSVSRLYEFCQANHLSSPVLVEVSLEERPDPKMHYMRFKVDQQLYGIGDGWNKKAAKTKAAGLALEALTKKIPSSGYAPVSTSEGDKFACLSWNWFVTLCSHTTDAWRFAGYKVLSTFILQRGSEDKSEIVSLGTGNKCISGDQLQLDGTSVNDSHAEVVARRGLVRYLIKQLELFFTNPEDPKCIFVQTDPKGKVKLREEIKLFLYCSTAPCGDAAIFVNGNKASCSVGKLQRTVSKHEGLLRTKVEKGEGTIPLDWSDGLQTIDGIRRGQRLRTASCSDKIAKWNVVGVQGGLLSSLIEPIYIDGIITGTLYEPTHMARAVSGRIEGKEQTVLSDLLPQGYHVNHPNLMSGRLNDMDNCRHVETKHRTNSLSLSWTMGDAEVEVHDGCSGRQAPSGSPSRLCKTAIFSSLREVLKKSSSAHQKSDLLDADMYNSAKELAIDYQRAKNNLYQHLAGLNLGSWELMKKPLEMSLFNFEFRDKD